jgi:hypothetical protein
LRKDGGGKCEAGYTPKMSTTKFVVVQKLKMWYSICAKVVIHNKYGSKMVVGASKLAMRLE